MATIIRAEISKKNKYWISRHRHYELKHFCLQYPSWVKEYNNLKHAYVTSYIGDGIRSTNNIHCDKTSSLAIEKMDYSNKIYLIEKAAKAADPDLYLYILRAVTEGHSYTYLKTVLDIPCSKDLYYERYRKFFWVLNKLRD